MSPPVSANFTRLIETINAMGAEAHQRASDTETYRTFIAAFPLARLPHLSAEEYCIGKGSDSFCWWIERGLEPALGRYAPGTSRGHIVYFRKDDGSFYKNRQLQDLSDEEALRYTLKIQNAIAAADLSQDITWIDNRQEVFRHAGVEARVTVGNGRKLRLLACYHPDDVLPISSSDLGHFLEALGCPKIDIPDADRPIARMLLLREYYWLARQSVPDLSTRGFMLALYNPTSGVVPPSRSNDQEDVPEEDDIPAPAYLLTWNPDHFELGGDANVVVGEEQRWTCHSKQPKIGDAVYLIRLGVEPRGVVATGVVTQESHEAPHWKDPSKLARYIHFRVNDFRPDAASGLLPMVLLALAMPDQKWSPQSSGIGLAEQTAMTLRRLWDSGARVHSLRQVVTWITSDPRVRREDWFEPYKQTVDLARSLRDDPARINEQVLDHLWRSSRNGITSVGPGAISSKEFKENLPLLADLTREIIAKPIAETLAAVEARWQQAVNAKTLTKMNRAVIRRVFSAASPESFTTLLREGDCQKLLALFKRQFELSPSASTRADWTALNADIVACMRQAGLPADQYIENNTAAWQLVDYLAAPAKPETTPSESAEPSAERPAPPLTMWPVNLVLYGPPGTGKTHRTIDEAIGLLAPELLEGEPDREDLKAKFDALVADGRIVFTTFHQSFSYEDFVEGLRAETDDDGQLHYRVVDGVFKRICRLCSGTAVNAERRRLEPPFEVGESFSGYQVKRATSDVLELTKPKGRDLPIGMSLLNELAALVRSGRITIDDIKEKRVFDKAPETTLEPFLVNGYQNVLPLLVERLASTTPPNALASGSGHDTAPRVLIIDEINRGNVARIFGELITLIEPSKRAGMPEAITVTLPYSKEPFSVPANLHIVATMNTADRSLVGLDIALRRRFEFREMQPRTELLDDVFVEGISVGELLRVMNERIELLLDRDHRLGHAYFLPLRDNPTIERLARVFRSHLLPLLQEYFFEDWQRIRWVLNDHRKPEQLQFITIPDIGLDRLFGNGVGVNEQTLRWHINEQAYLRPEAYAGVIAAAS
jgi:5-methylcytosine-specific restriction protein B